MSAFLRENWLTIAIVAALAVGYVLLRTPSDEASTSDVASAIAQGQPAVIEFYSNT
ncbi:MAG: hypothetical protein GX557_01340 [Chloroflexi bacterium]|nr:hypothetical protein [Chloroflexota bacterium]